MMASQPCRWTCTCLFAALLLACEDNATEPSGPQARIQFQPTPGTLVLGSCTSQEFRVSHPDDEPLTVRYWIGEALVGENAAFIWDELPPGEFVVRVEARSDEGEERTETWLLKVGGPDCQPDPGGGEVFFFPKTRELDVEPFTSVLFRASHREFQPLRLEYRVDGSPASDKRLFEWTAELPSEHLVRAIAHKSGGGVEFAEWKIRVVDRVSTPVPVVEAVTLERLEPVGRARLSWRRAYSGQIQVPIADYVVYAATEPFESVDAPGVASHSFEDDPTQRLHSVELEGLEGGKVNYVRVVARDLMGRRSELSESTSAYVTGLFEISGRCLQFSPSTGLWMPAASLQIRWNERATLTSFAGRYRLSELSDYHSGRLFVTDSSGRLAPMRTEEISSSSPLLNFHALPLVHYFMQLEDGLSSSVALPKLLKIFSGTNNSADHRPKPIHRWERYPIDVHAIDYTHVGNEGEVVQYGPILENAIALWNAAADRALFRAVHSPPETGVVVSVDLSPLSGLLGQTVITRPYRGNTFDDAPQEITIQLRKFNTEAVARRIIVHELGHALLLGHSPDATHVMHGSATQLNPTELEGTVAAFLSVMPQGLDMNRYRD